MSLAVLSQYLRTSEEAIFTRWQAAVFREAVPSARGLQEPQLRNSLPALFEDIVIAIAGEPAPTVEAEGREHGRQRWGLGYDIGEVLRELFLFRQTLLDVVNEYAVGASGLACGEQVEALRRILDVIDRSAQAGAARFHTETIAARELLEQELTAANKQLKAANEAKDRFLAMLSHELRNPLAPILAAVQLLEYTEATDCRLRQAREVIERQVRHQARLIDDLLDVSRITQGKIALRQEIHDLRAAVTHAVESCQPAIQGKSQELRVELSAEALPVDADRVRMEQVITNLLTNAHRYTEPGGSIWLTVGKEDGAAIVRVRDSGIGISPVLLPRVFELFVQADTSLDRPHGGLGIGLTLVKSLVELHGGAVEAHSAGLGAGSEFVVRLPLVAAVPARWRGRARLLSRRRARSGWRWWRTTPMRGRCWRMY
jgi:signal transduction histidine kinase